MIIIFELVAHSGNSDRFKTSLIESRAVSRSERHAGFDYGYAYVERRVIKQVDCVRVGRHGIVKVGDVYAEAVRIVNGIDGKHQRFDVLKIVFMRLAKGF